MDRRSFLGSATAALAWASAARAQPVRSGRIGILYGARPGDPIAELQINEVRNGLAEQGWVEGRNLTIDVRLTLADPALSRAYAAELIAQQPDALLSGSLPNALALQALTDTIPIVFESVQDPIGAGLIKSFSRPDRNITGFTNFEPTMVTKYVELLHLLRPDVSEAALLYNPNTAAQGGALFWPYFQEATASFGLIPSDAQIRSVEELEPAVAAIAARGACIVIPQDNFFFTNRSATVEVINRLGVTTVYPFQDMVKEGGLIGYAPNSPIMYRQGGVYLGRILNGLSPADLPVQSPTNFLLVVNLRTAAEQGIEIPVTLIATADVIVER